MIGWYHFLGIYLLFSLTMTVGCAYFVWSNWNQRGLFRSYWPVVFGLQVIFAPFVVLYQWWRLS